MPDERIDIISPEGHATGRTAMKSEAHRMGWFHNSVHIWFYTINKYILLQKRAATKDIFPALWDISVAGHVGIGEHPITSAIREINEEIGIPVTATSLLPIGTHKAMKTPTNHIFDNEFHHIYCCLLEQDINTLSLQKEEVEAVKLISLTDFEFQLKNPSTKNNYVPHASSYYYRVIKTLQEL